MNVGYKKNTKMKKCELVRKLWYGISACVQSILKQDN